MMLTLGSGALTQGSTRLLQIEKDQNDSIHQKLLGGPQMGPRVAWYHYRDEYELYPPFCGWS